MTAPVTVTVELPYQGAEFGKLITIGHAPEL
jgi:hypothetical protein